MAEKKPEGPLQQYLVLAKNTKGKAAGPLVLQALGAPGLYHFGELISHPNIAPLERDDKPTFDALRIFAYGTLADYRNAPGLPELSAGQLTKLRQLTIVSLATETKVIPYSILIDQLGIKNLRELEDLIIDCFYAGLIRGKLDQKEKQLEVDWAVARDLRPGQVESMIAFLNNWVTTSDVLLKAIEDQISHAASAHEANRVHKKEFDERVETIKANLKVMMEADMGGDYIPGSEMFDDDRKGKKGGMAKRGGPGRKGPKRGFMAAREWFN